MFFYSDTAVRSGVQIDVWKMNGTAAYLRHYENLMFLSFMAKSGTRSERADAEKELVICRRKLAFWEKHPNYDGAAVIIGVEAINKQWRSKPGLAA